MMENNKETPCLNLWQGKSKQTTEQIRGQIALWPAKPGSRYAMTGKVTLPVEMLIELIELAGDLRSEVDIGLILWDNSSSSKPGAPTLSGYANLPPEPQQIKPKRNPHIAPRSDRNYGELPF